DPPEPDPKLIAGLPADEQPLPPLVPPFEPLHVDAERLVAELKLNRLQVLQGAVNPFLLHERGRVIGNGADAVSPQIQQRDVQLERDEAAVDRAANLAVQFGPVEFVGRGRQGSIPAVATWENWHFGWIKVWRPARK